MGNAWTGAPLQGSEWSAVPIMVAGVDFPMRDAVSVENWRTVQESQAKAIPVPLHF